MSISLKVMKMQTRVIDNIQFELPLGVIGRKFRQYAKAKLRNLFNYKAARHKTTLGRRTIHLSLFFEAFCYETKERERLRTNFRRKVILLLLEIVLFISKIDTPMPLKALRMISGTLLMKRLKNSPSYNTPRM